MPALRVNRELKDQKYFITLTIFRWYYLFDRYERWEILADSIEHCQRNKHLMLHGFVFMLNHVHLIVSSPDVIGFLRDFKSFTSRKIKANLLLTEPHLLNLFNNKDGDYQFWQKTNMPKLVESEWFYMQKSNYIQNNPVKKGYVSEPSHWYWSSANESCRLRVNSEF